MSGIQITHRFSGDLGAGLDRLIAAGQDLSPFTLKASAIMYEATMDRFEDEIDPLGVPWKPSRRAIEEGGKTLQKSRQLKDAIKQVNDKTSASVGVSGEVDLQRDADSTSVKNYARIHQEGGVIKPRHKKALSFAGRVFAQIVMPRRAYLGFSEGEIRELDAALGAHIKAAWAGVWGGARGMKIGPIVERLKAAGFGHVEGVLEFSALKDPPRADRAVFVVPTSDSGAGAAGRGSGVLDQKVIWDFDVVLILSGLVRQRDGVDERLAEDVDLIQRALFAWMHPEASSLTEYVSGRKVPADGGPLVWAIRFRSAYHLRSQAQ